MQFSKKILIFFLFLFQTLFIYSSPISVISGGTGLSAITASALLAGGTTSTGSIQTLSTGTPGQVLTSNGASALPTWTKNNGFILLKTLTASSSSTLTFTASDFNTAFKIFAIIINGFDPSALSNLIATWSTNDGSSYISSGYTNTCVFLAYNSATLNRITTTTSLQLTTGSSVQFSAVLFLFGMNGTFASGTGPALLGWTFAGASPSNYGMVYASVSGSPNVNNMRFAPSTGNFTVGKISLYGIIT